MNNKFDKTTPLAEYNVPNTPALQPNHANLPPVIIQGQVVMPHLINLSTLEVFKKRLDNWQPVYVTLYEKQYQLDQLFNHYLTLNDLKNSIHTLKDMTNILTHPKLSLVNRNILFNALVSIFPKSANVNDLPEPFCDDKFMELLIKNSDDLKSILNLITDHPGGPYITRFLRWIKEKSPYIQGIIDKNHAVAPAAPVFRPTFAEHLPVAPIFRQNNMSQSEPLFLRQQRRFPMNHNQNQNQSQKRLIQNSPNTLINTFIKRILGMDKNDLSSFIIFQDKLFDKDCSVGKLKENIRNLEDLLDIFIKGNLQPKACYSLFNYLISVFPLPKNNGNLRACPCDEAFLKKIIKSQDDLKKIYSFMASYHTRNLVQILEKRLAHSPYYTIILRAKVIPQNDFNGLNYFFCPSVQLNTPPKPRLVTNPKSEPIHITDENGMEMNFEDQDTLHSDPFTSKPKRKLSQPDDLEESVNSRPSKRQKENPVASALNTKQIEPQVKERATIVHPLSQLSGFFAKKADSPMITQEPEGGEYEYLLDDHGNVLALLEPK